MLLLVTIGLVLVGAVSLVIGFATNELPWIYLSIVCSIVAAGVLVLFSRMSRQAPAAAGDGPTPLAETGEPTLATAAVEVEPETAPVVVPEAAAAAVDAGDVFPIEGYDKLRVNEIMPRLSGLSVSELEAVREREAAGKNRASVIARIDDLISQQESVEAEAGAAAEPAAAEVGAVAGEELDNIDDLIEDYDKLSVNQIIPLLGELEEDELEDVAAYEEDHKNRAAILDRIDALLEGEELPTPAKAATSTAGAAKKSAVAKKVAAAKKSAAKVGAATKKAAPAKKAAASATKKAAPAKKAATAVKKTAAKKAAAPAKKTVAKKAAKATKTTKR